MVEKHAPNWFFCQWFMKIYSGPNEKTGKKTAVSLSILMCTPLSGILKSVNHFGAHQPMIYHQRGAFFPPTNQRASQEAMSLTGHKRLDQKEKG
jgi:hypothetical protein